MDDPWQTSHYTQPRIPLAYSANQRRRKNSEEPRWEEIYRIPTKLNLRKLV